MRHRIVEYEKEFREAEVLEGFERSLGLGENFEARRDRKRPLF